MAIEAIKLIWEWEKDPASEFYVKPEEFETQIVPGYKYPMKTKHGIFLFNDVVNITCIKELKIRPEDTFIIGFPKSGMNIDTNIYNLNRVLNYVFV